jgi:hypothetical protein
VFVTNHVLSGALIGHVLSRRPATAFVVGVASHLALDAVPHWGCETSPNGRRERFLLVARRDGVLGLGAMGALALAAPRQTRPAVIAGMVGAALLDIDKPLKHFFGWNPFPGAVQRVHEEVQNESSEGLPNEIRFGVGFAVADIAMSCVARGRGPQA